jgi:hypothetical protein
MLTVDKIEIFFEKQPITNACKWLVLIKVQKKKEKIALIVKTNHKLEVNFLENKNNIVKNYNKIKG